VIAKARGWGSRGARGADDDACSSTTRGAHGHAYRQGIPTRAMSSSAELEDIARGMTHMG
jgi:hypothetical protein